MAAASIKKTLQLVASVGGEAYPPPYDHYIQDHLWHAALAKFTGGISPTSLMLAGFDWWQHLLFSPSTQQLLMSSLLDKTAQISDYTMKAIVGADVAPIITPPPTDRRFTGDGWQKWPFNMMQQGFLLSQAWWLEATTGVRGVSPHHRHITSFIAQQLLDVVAPSNFPLTNPDIWSTTQAQGGANFWHGMLNWLDDTMRSRMDTPPQGTKNFIVGKILPAPRGWWCSVIISLSLYNMRQPQHKCTPSPYLSRPHGS